jgi:hypothetical protein
LVKPHATAKNKEKEINYKMKIIKQKIIHVFFLLHLFDYDDDRVVNAKQT